MKVLFLSHQADFIYGGEICTLSFMEELSRQGVEVHFASPPGAYAERAAAFAACHEIPSIQFSRNFSLLPSLAVSWKSTESKLGKIIRREQIEVLHATSLKAMVYAWSLRRKLPVVWHHHDILPAGFWNDQWANLLAKGARLILAPSAATRLALVQSGVSPVKVKVLNNGFKVDEWQARPERKGGELTLGFVGELSERKGVDRLPEILRACNQRMNCRLLLVGDAVSDPVFGKTIRKAFEGFGKKVEFLGRRNDVKEILQGVDVLLVPSRQDPLPTVIVEAGLSGVPVVASPVGGIAEMVTDGENGYLAAENPDWVERIHDLEDAETWRKCASGARELAVERYDIVRLAAELTDEYERLLASE
ncbi:MAG: glycosyltransferase family 4 protein [Bacteriovoracia bacterium]